MPWVMKNETTRARARPAQPFSHSQSLRVIIVLRERPRVVRGPGTRAMTITKMMTAGMTRAMMASRPIGICSSTLG